MKWNKNEMEKIKIKLRSKKICYKNYQNGRFQIFCFRNYYKRTGALSDINVDFCWTTSMIVCIPIYFHHIILILTIHTTAQKYVFGHFIRNIQNLVEDFSL